MTHNIFSSIIPALGWTLLHSLWQGLIAATIALIILSLTRKTRPAYRYNALLGVMILFVMSMVTTFVLQFSNDKVVEQNIATTYKSYNEAATIQLPSYDQGMITAIESTLNKHIDIIVSIWLLLLCLQ